MSFYKLFSFMAKSKSLVIDYENEEIVCKHCGKKIGNDVKLKGLSVICPNCDKPI